ncbi:GMC family oxidoreductase [Arcobacter sp. YIC-310]|uniref:GMC family oxidoreductase n=1 Tax=Arcobacter sp. YIC-310 TaxID=3376632 RepID=UPI003C22F2C3
MMYDICVIGSGAGAGPIIYELSKAGFKVCVLEKGEVYKRKDFSKDEIATVRRDIYTPKLDEEYHTIEENIDGKWIKFPTYETGWSFWNGNILGGSSNFMSGFFYRLKPNDFKLKTIYGKAKGSNIEDWPISYEELEPFYDKVEKIVGVSGEPSFYKHQEPRSSKNFPFKPLDEHPIVKLIDKASTQLAYSIVKTPRAIISKNSNHRSACYYSNYCGSYACSSGAKGSSREALILPSLKTNNVTIISNAFVYKLNVNKEKKIISANYYTKEKKSKEIKAKLFVVAAQAIETSRLLLNSKSEAFPKGLANNSGNVGKNFLSTAGGVVSGTFDETNMELKQLLKPGLFVNRAIKDFYYTKDFKGGMIELVFDHANPIKRANSLKWDGSKLLIGKALQDKLYEKFTKTRTLNMEIFVDWTPNDNSFISVDEKYKDKYGVPVANIRIGAFKDDIKVSKFLEEKAIALFKQMKVKNINSNISELPAQNLLAGGCRFGDDPKTSVLNKHCQAHEINNLFISDASFMPTGGSVPYTFTIYANSFRVAEYIKKNYDKIMT